MPDIQKGKKVKGALLVPLAMVINGSMNIDWTGKTEVTDKDLKLLKAGVFASQWYDSGLFERLGNAVYKMIGNSNPEMAVQFGRGAMYQTLGKIYRGPLLSDDPKEILTKFAELFGTTWFNFGHAEFNPEGKGGIFRMTDPDGFAFGLGFAGIMKGALMRVVEESGHKNISVEQKLETIPGTEKIIKLDLFFSWD